MRARSIVKIPTLLLVIYACTDYHEEAFAPEVLSVSVSTLTFPEEASTQSITVRSRDKWEVSSTPGWLVVESIDNRLAFSYEWPVTFSSQVNNGYNREGTIILGTAKESVSIPVEQKGKRGAFIAVESVSVKPEKLSLTKGDAETLTATIQPYNASEQSIKWSSSDPTVADVSSTGLVTAVEVGHATITVTTGDGGKTATCVVTVNPVAVSGVSLNKTSLSLTIGENETLVATVTPSNAANKNVTWSSSNTGVATVDQNGKVSAISVGSATITVSTEDGGKKATCLVTVNPIVVNGVSLNKTSLSLLIGDTDILTATVSPSNATNKNVTWSSSNTNVATVDTNGKVTAIAVGSATITVTTEDGGKKAYCTVTVNPISVTGVSLNKSSLSLLIGSIETLTATVMPSNATNQKVTWSSSNTNVATVDTNGKVTAISVGSTTITATTEDGGKKASCTVTVNPVSVTGVSLNKSSLSLLIGSTETLTATVSPSNATNKSLTWSSSNTNIATVDSNGKVTAIAVGSTTVTVTTEDGGKKASCTVTVNPISVTGISLNKTTLSLIIGETETLTATVSPSNATDKACTWSSSNTSIATVDSNGKVTAVAVGSATITAKTNDGGKTATCSVTVKPISVSSVSLDKTSITMTVGDLNPLTATVSPSNATDKSVTWTSSDTSVATVSTVGLVTAKAAGTATITVKTNDGGKTATCSVTVKAKTISVTGVSLNYTSLSMTEGDTQTLTATISPSNATDKSVTWSSSNTAVATVSSSGIVTAKTAGNATITVTTNDGGKTATCSVTVKSKTISVTGVSLNYTSLSMTEGDTQTLTATIIPSNATNKSVTWSSSNTSVATVSSSGLVTAKSAGSATITVKTNDGNKTATCTVTVKSRDLNGSGNEGSNEEEMF